MPDAKMNTSSSEALRRRGMFFIFFGASVWGLFWLPMHHFDEQGLSALWSVAAINIAASLIAIPVAIWKREFILKDARWIIIIGLGMGFSNVFYFASLTLTDVVRAVFLFYLLPIWATVFSKLIYNIPIGPARIVALVFAIVGIWLLLGAGGWPIPQNIGDVFALVSGMGWAIAIVLINGRSNVGSLATSGSSLFFAALIAIIVGYVMSVIQPDIQKALPRFSDISDLLLPVLAFGVLVLWPSITGIIWGSRHVEAPTAALFTMSEILVATISVTLLIGSELALISWLGGGLIVMAIFIDVFAGGDA